MATAAAFGQTYTPTAADGFDPNVDGNVYALARQGDGKIIVAGQFANFTPNGGVTWPRHNLARLNTDGTLDANFNPDVNGAVRAVAIESDGQIVIVGDFTTVGGESHKRVARINANGTVDSSFKAGIGESLTDTIKPTPQAFALALQATDGAIVVGGSFGSAQGADGVWVARKNIVRFTAAGAVDATYNPGINGIVLALALHVDNKIIVGGNFTQISAPEATTRLRVARLNPNGTVDSEFDPKANDGVTTIAIQRDGKILLGGYFTTLQPITDTSAMTRNRIGRLNADGSLDSEFHPTIGGQVTTIAVTPDGSILVGGRFSQVIGASDTVSTTPFAAKLSDAGVVDESFYPGLNSEVSAFAVQDDGKIIIGGYFTRAQPTGLTVPLTRNHLARVLPNGALDTAFQLDEGGRVLASIVQEDGKIVIGGSFTSVGGVPRAYIARLNTDGSLDTTYNPELNGRVYTMAYQNGSKENKVIIGGSFTTVGDDDRMNLARLNANGTVDSEFNVKVDGSVAAITVQSDGKILIGGAFAKIDVFGTDSEDPVARANIARLTNDGKLDTTFNPTTNSTVTGIALQTNQQIIIVGGFTQLQPGATGTVYTRSRIARLNADGTLDTAYNPNASSDIFAVVLQSDGKAIVGGRFQAFLPNSETEITYRNYLARLNTDGSVDSTYDPNPNGMVFALALQPDGKLLMGGAFTTLEPKKPTAATDWTLRKYFARLNADGTIDTTLNLDLTEQLGGRVETITALQGNSFVLGGTFVDLKPTGSTARVLRHHFAKITSTGTLDPFNPGAGGSVSGTINSIVVQTDGKIMVGGQFSDLGGATSTNIARFNPEGSADSTFNTALSTNTAGTVNALAVRANGLISPTQLGGFAWLESSGNLRTSFNPDPAVVKLEGRINAVIETGGKIIVAGTFTDLRNNAPDNIARFNLDGSLDTTFKPAVDGGIYDLALQSDGKIIIAGAFTTVGEITRRYVARLDPTTGAPDSFDPSPDASVNAVIIQNDGAVVLGGSFTSLTPNSATDATTRAYIARVSSSGTVQDYNPTLNGAVNSLALQTDGKIIAGGSFTTAQPNSASSTTERNYIARFNTDGTLDSNFDPSPDGVVNAIVVQPWDQFILIGGAFSKVSSQEHLGLARLGSDGTALSSFVPATNGTVAAIGLQSDRSILIAGYFTTVTENGSETEIARNHLARFSETGALDSTYNPDIAGNVLNVFVRSDNSAFIGGPFDNLHPKGVVLVGGSFTTIGGLPTANLAQLNGDGSVNSTFQPAPDGAVQALVTRPDGSFLVGGTFTRIAGAARNGLARFNDASELDTAFNPSLTNGVVSLAVQADNKILVGTGGLTGLIRLNADGSRDAGFSAPAFVPAMAIAVQPDGKIVVAGAGSGIPARVVRLNADGSLDATFTAANVTGSVRTLALQTDGKIVVAGDFTAIGGQAYANLARLQANGSVDATFNPGVNGAVTALALQSDGRLMLGGKFTAIGTMQRYALARIGNTEAARQTLGVLSDRTTVSWQRAGTSGQLTGVTFELSSDNETWSILGAGTRVAGTNTWQLTNASLPASTTFYLRARGIAPTSSGTSAGVYESARVLNFASPVAGISLPIDPVVSTSTWDETHLVWSFDPVTGLLQVVDSYTGAVVDSSRTGVLGRASSFPTTGTRGQLANLSTRGFVTPANPVIGGLTISGSAPRTVLIRAAGPTLTVFGITKYLKQPHLLLYKGSTVIAENSGWAPELSEVFTRTGAFGFLPGSTDSAFVTTLEPGSYTYMVVDGEAGGTGGETLIEVYDVNELSDTSARLTNLSSRGMISSGSYLIGGMYVAGSTSRTVLIRGVGPGLKKFGLTDIIENPVITVYDAAGNVVVTNDDWQVSQQPTIPELDYGAAIRAAGDSVSAFAFDAGSKDAGLVVTLPAGGYTVILKAADGTDTGEAMIELYELP
ncbi:hypothetical protein [Opitutus sp. ER46]|uniref:hypothetical protein n=1 Tax=Opitutus sp. ER46 TaxID=2161864 RepID=UPI001304DFFF|nr:hypothetical protein [Opitutus sp. ER46]